MVNSSRHVLLCGALFALLTSACTNLSDFTSPGITPTDAGADADAGAALRFKVGGTVKGLAGKRLVLQNNGGDDLTIGEDGSFTFPTALPSGAPYAVTVKESPSSPTQTCTVSGGAGTVIAGNVSSIVVNCDTNTYTLGGTITGLAGIGLVVQSSGGESLAINANGTFALPTPVKSGQPYEVTVKTQPGLPSQTCTVSGGKGTVAAANVTDIAIDCTTNKFSIGGTVHGLIGTGFILKNGEEELKVAEDGTFTFPTSIESGQPYDVTVKRNPFAPSQKCAVSGGSGIVGSGNVSSVVVNCETNTYTVGGTVTGLVGTGLVLQSSGGDNLTLTSNGTFAFATPVKSGKSYEVTVATQPGAPSQTCAVSNGSGTIEGANVTDVAIVCTINKYAVGGTVTGLSGTGLVLQNGTEDLPVAADGTFTFPTTVASGQPYAVTVKKNPLAPAQTCTVSGASGVVVAGNVSSVAVNCSTNSYTVGGMITGLAGSGLVLQNGTEELPVAADGSFAFPTPVKSGQPYEVTVKSQPALPSQTCTVTSASGTVAAANVATVAIACTTNKYAIGGTVSGLAGPGLVLKSGDDELPVAANGSFTFPTAVASGQPYAVSVKHNPSTPAQTCTVSGASGAVVAGNVTSVVVNCNTNTYAVGGSISGLAGSGLVLQNGTEELPISVDGLFAFPTPVESGKAYNVIVKTQPASPSQTCTVTSPSGTVAAANVNDVSVACTTNKYSIGGSVSGLAGSGLVLQNGADELPVAADGTFTFPTMVASGQSYAVSVKTAPTAPWQTCSVTHGAGLVVAGNVSAVSISCTTSTFSIGGSVSGLVGSGLVLQNGTEELPIAIDGTFTFPTRVASGGSYAIIVKSQPTTPSQTCDVTGGSGPVAGSNISSASVTCTTDTFTVGAAVSGLPGGTLVLQNNAGNDLAVSANGTFTFSTAIASGASYAVTIKTLPAGANCEVAGDATGTIGSAGVTATVTCSPCGAATQACCMSGTACGSGLACSSGLTCETAAPVCSTTPGIGFFSPVNYAVGGRLQSVEIGDFNLDGKPDLVTANAVTTVVSVLLGKGDGTFEPSVDVNAGNNPGDAAVGDFDGDGKPDIAVANAGGNNVSVLLNTCAAAPCATPSFAAPVYYASGNRPRRITVGDVNRDNVLDILTANENSNSISVLLGNGNGTFQAKVDFNPIGTQPYDVQLADFNGDNKLDIVAVNFGMGDTAAVFLNTCNSTPCASPSFAPAVTYAVGESPMGVTVGDFNGDGRKDIATANYFSSDVSILLGNGNGTFQNAVNYPSASLPSHITATDLDDDGYLDLVTSVDIGSLISVFRGRGDGTFEAKVDFNVGQSGASDVSKATAAADFDGDGDIDLAVAVDLYNHVSMMMNGRVSCVVP